MWMASSAPVQIWFGASGASSLVRAAGSSSSQCADGSRPCSEWSCDTVDETFSAFSNTSSDQLMPGHAVTVTYCADARANVGGGGTCCGLAACEHPKCCACSWHKANTVAAESATAASVPNAPAAHFERGGGGCRAGAQGADDVDCSAEARDLRLQLVAVLHALAEKSEALESLAAELEAFKSLYKQTILLQLPTPAAPAQLPLPQSPQLRPPSPPPALPSKPGNSSGPDHGGSADGPELSVHHQDVLGPATPRVSVNSHTVSARALTAPPPPAAGGATHGSTGGPAAQHAAQLARPAATLARPYSWRDGWRRRQPPAAEPR